VEVPERWERLGTEGPGPFVTAELLRAPDGRIVRWQSRSRRKASPHRRRADRGAPAGEPVWWRPRRREWWMATLFVLGSFCFLAGGVAAQWSRTSRPAIGVVFFVGSIFFTSAAYLQFAEAVNVERALERGPATPAGRWRPASWEPRRIDWLAALVQLVGTVFFNVTTFTGMKHGFSVRQTNARVWAPDAVGSIAFLISSELAYAEVCGRWVGWRWSSLSWRIVALNLLGSIAFGVSAVASFVEPAGGEPLSARLANGGTSLGGLCFLVGALLLMPEAAAAQGASAGPAAGSPAASPVSS
jgi:YrhK-like protein